MKKALIFVVAIGLLCMLTSCATRTRIYDWEKYNERAEECLANYDEQTAINLIAEYEKMIKNQESSERKVVPPGVYADYGYLLIKIGKKQEGKKYLQKEMEIYPESKTYLNKVVGGL
jgi:hypothetical protein